MAEAASDMLGILTEAEQEDLGSLDDGTAGHYRQAEAAKCIRRLYALLTEARRRIDLDAMGYERGKVDGWARAICAVENLTLPVEGSERWLRIDRGALAIMGEMPKPRPAPVPDVVPREATCEWRKGDHEWETAQGEESAK